MNCTTNVEGIIGQKLPILVMLYFIETPFPRLLPSFCWSANLRTMCSFYKYLVCRLCGYCLLLLLLDSCLYLLACADGIGLLLVLFSVGLSQHDDTFLILCLLCIFSLCGLLVSYSLSYMMGLLDNFNYFCFLVHAKLVERSVLFTW